MLFGQQSKSEKDFTANVYSLSDGFLSFAEDNGNIRNGF